MTVYLDIDGVMVPANSWRQPLILEDGFPEFSRKAVNALNKIILLSGAKVILTTSHKHKYSLSDWRKIFERRNLNVNRISRLPENNHHLNRKDELMQWFSSINLKDYFLIIDDDKSLNSLPSDLKDKLIQTSGSVGLTDYLAEEAISKIKKHVPLRQNA